MSAHDSARPFKPRRFTPARKLKICHLVATVEGGLWCFEQLRDLRDRYGHDVTAILSGDSGTLPGLFRAAGIRVLVADFELGGKAGGGMLRRVRTLAALLAREHFDVAQTHLINTMLVGRAAAWLADVPVRLAMVAGPFHLQAYTPRWMDQWTAWMETGLIPSCRLSYDLYRQMGVPVRKLQTIYYGPDESRFDPDVVIPAGLRAAQGWPENTPVVMMVAYFYPRMPAGSWIPAGLEGKALKGHEDLVRAAPSVRKEFPDAKFVFVGGGWGAAGEEFLQDVKNLAGRLGLKDDVIFLGPRSDVPNLYRDASVAVQPSLNENLGGSVEMLLMRCPTVVTRVGGLVDSVQEGETGIVVLPANPESLAEGILRLLRQPASAARMGENGRARMLEKFTLTCTVDDLAQLYEDQLAAGPGRYRSFIRALRYLTGIAVFAAIWTRYRLVDMDLLVKWPARRRRISDRLGGMRGKLRRLPRKLRKRLRYLPAQWIRFCWRLPGKIRRRLKRWFGL